MSLPIGEIGASAISGGAVVAFVMKMLPILLRKSNGIKKNRNNRDNPGKAKICIERGLKIKEFDMAILGLCRAMERVDKQLELQHTENREDFQRIFNKIDEIKK